MSCVWKTRLQCLHSTQLTLGATWPAGWRARALHRVPTRAWARPACPCSGGLCSGRHEHVGGRQRSGLQRAGLTAGSSRLLPSPPAHGAQPRQPREVVQQPPAKAQLLAVQVLFEQGELA